VARVVAGHSKFLLKRKPMSERSGAKILQPVVLTEMQGKGSVRQRSIFADLTFWLLLGQAKSNSLSRGD